MLKKLMLHTNQTAFDIPTARRSGFTIVELLIVIVVIGILAAITVVAYNGITNQAKQVANVSAVQSYVKSLQYMKTDTGNLPAGNGANSSCLGPDPMPATCNIAGQTATGNSAATLTTKSQLQNYGLKSQPAVGIAYGGYLVYTDAFYGEPALLWQVPAGQDCVSSARRMYQYPSSSWVNGIKFSQRTTYTDCALSLSDL